MSRQVAAIVIDTLHEARSRKVVASILLGSILGIGALYWMLRGMPLSGPSSIVAMMSQTDQRYLNEQWVARGVFGNTAMLVFGLQLIICLMNTMSLVPGLLDPGRNAWLASHPISRSGILMGRFLGFFAIATASTAITFTGAWVVVGMKTNLWHLPFFFGMVTTLVLYASFSSVVLLLHMASSSPALMATGVSLIAVLSGAASRPEEVKGILGDGPVYGFLMAAASALPRVMEVGRLTDAYVQTGVITDHRHIWFSLTFGMICFALASWRFSRRDL